MADETPEFEPLAVWLSRARIPVVPEPERVAPERLAQEPAVLPEVGDLLRDVRLFRARLADEMESARERLLCELATAVLGRELQLAPVDLARIVSRVNAACASATPVCVRVAPADVASVPPHAMVRADPTLEPGDIVLEFTDRTVDARFGVRLAAVLAAWA